MAITLTDLVKCGQGDIIVSMLIDAKAFFDYDQRENGQTLDVYEDFWDFPYDINKIYFFILILIVWLIKIPNNTPIKI